MAKLNNDFNAWTGKKASEYTNGKFNQAVGTAASTAGDLVGIAGKAAVLTLSKAWIGIGMVKPASTERRNDVPNIEELQHKQITRVEGRVRGASGAPLDRFDYEKLYSLQLGDYFLPLSQTFTLRAKKKLNVSHLVDGVDIIQQTRKEAKTIDCSLRISLRENQNNLQIVDINNEMQQLSWFLSDLYDDDAVFAINNDMVNNTFGVTYAIMSEYKFIPRVSMGTYTFEFSLTEVKYDDNVLTFDLREIGSNGTTLTGD